MSYDSSLSSQLEASFTALCDSADAGVYAGAYEPDSSVSDVPLVDMLRGTSWASEMASATFSDADVAPQGRQAAQADRPKLDKIAATLTPPPVNEAVKQLSKKSEDTISRWKIKHCVTEVLRQVPEGEKTPSVCKCGTSGYDKTSIDLTRRKKSLKPGVRGVIFCDSPWLCPTCGPKRAGERSDRVKKVFNATKERKGAVIFVTLTIRHSLGMSLSQLRKVVDGAAADARRGGPWKRAVAKWNIAGVLKSPEVTYGMRTGWHYHLHLAIVLLPSELDLMEEDPAGVVALKGLDAGEWLIERYMAYVERAGFSCRRKAQDVQYIENQNELAKYIAKGSAVWEVASAGATKTRTRYDEKGNKIVENKHRSVTPWDLAVQAGQGNKRAENLFREYAGEMPGTRACIVTKSLAEKLGIDAESDDDSPGIDEVDDIVEESGEEREDEDPEEVVMSLQTERWNKLLRRGYASFILSQVAVGVSPKSIDDVIAELLGETEFDRRIDGLSTRKPLVRKDNNLHHVSAGELAAEASYIQARRASKTSKGVALQLAIQKCRDDAERRNKVLVLPNLKIVIRILTEGYACLGAVDA